MAAPAHLISLNLGSQTIRLAEFRLQPHGALALMNYRFHETPLDPATGERTDPHVALQEAIVEGASKRVVLLSDGNQNRGNAEAEAEIARRNGVEIDVVPLGAGHRNENEVLVERVEAPTLTEQGARLPIRVLIRSYNPRMVTGTTSTPPHFGSWPRRGIRRTTCPT